jgi:hypothetical protein
VQRINLSSNRVPVWLEERDLASRWNVSHYTVQRMRKAGKLKAKKLGGRWKYREDWVWEYEDQEDTQCPKSSESENGSSTGDRTVQTGVCAGTTRKRGRRDVHRSAQAIFKRPKSGSHSMRSSMRG